MIFRDVGHWSNLDDLRGMLFFAQIIEELTFPYSLDSNKAPTINAPFLVHEVIEQIGVCLREDIGLASVGHIIDEMEKRLRNNIVVNALITVNLERYLNFNRDNSNEISKKLHVLAREIEPHTYTLKCMELLNVNIMNKRKKNIEFIAREMATTLVNLGMNAEYINSNTVDFFFNKDRKIDSIEVLEEFYSLIYPNSHQFNVCFQIWGLSEVLDEDKIGMFNMKISESLPTEFSGGLSVHSFDGTKENHKYITLSEISAMDVNTAIRNAEARISQLHDLFTVFHHRNQFELSDFALVEQCCVGGIRKIGRPRNRMHFVSDHRPKKASKKLDDLIKYVSLPSGGDRERFFRVVDFHSKGVNSDATEGQIINIWISLETITPPNAKISKIDNVVTGVIPFIGLNYYRRIFDQLAFDLIRWNRFRLTRLLKEIKVDESAGIVDKVAMLVVLSDFDEIRRSLYKDLKDFELLRYRVFRLNEILSTPKNALIHIQEHQARVHWQLRRIYRTRNSVVHSGALPEYANMLVENAHDYFDQVFDLSCKLSMGPNGFWDFEECFDYARWRYEQYVSDIKGITEFTRENIVCLMWRASKELNESYRYTGQRWS